MKHLSSKFLFFFIIQFLFFNFSDASDYKVLVREIKDIAQNSEKNFPVVEKVVEELRRAEKKQTWSEDRLEKVEKHVSQLEKTPGESDKKVKRKLADFMFGSPVKFNIEEFCDENSDLVGLSNIQDLDAAISTPVKANAKRHKLISSEKKIEKRQFIFASKLVDTPERLKYSTVDTVHIETPKIKRGQDGVIKDVSGGHSLIGYSRDDVADDCFISADECTLGIKVGPFFKTVKKRFPAEEIVMLNQDREEGRFVAVDDSTGMKIKRGFDRKYYGIFDNQDFRVEIVNTIFPLLVVKAPSVSDLVHIGSCVKFSSSLKVYEDVDRIDVPQAQYQEFLRQGVRLTPYPDIDEVVVDITQPVKAYLTAQGKIAPIAGIYGVYKK